MYQCLECQQQVFVDMHGQPISLYWLSNDGKTIIGAFCNAQCSLDYHKKNPPAPFLKNPPKKSKK